MSGNLEDLSPISAILGVAPVKIKPHAVLFGPKEGES